MKIPALNPRSLLLFFCILFLSHSAFAQTVSISVDTSVKALPLLVKIDTMPQGKPKPLFIRIYAKPSAYLNLDTSSFRITPLSDQIFEISPKEDSMSFPVGLHIPLMRFVTDSSQWQQRFAIEFLNKNRQVITTQQLEMDIPPSVRSSFTSPCNQTYHGFSTVDLNHDLYADAWMAAEGDLHSLPPTAGFGSAKVIGNSSGANWITPTSSGANGSNAAGYYTYRMAFCATAATSALINMRISVDDVAKVYFNGVHLGNIGVAGMPYNTYTMSNLPVTLTTGTNVLDIVVQNITTSNWSSYITGIWVDNAAITTQSGVLGLQSNACCAPGWIAGTKLWDKNCNGVWELGDNPLSGWTIELLDMNGQVLQQQLTDANGHYVFMVPAGTYTVRESMAGHAGWTSSVSAGPYANIVVVPLQTQQRDFLNCSPFRCEDLFSQQTQSDECCKASFTISNSATIALQNVHYVVNGGVINSITSSPCVPTGQTPVNLSNTVTGNLTFAAACTGNNPMLFNVNATATNATGLVEIIWTATFQEGANTFSCKDTTYIQCERAPLVCNTQVDVVQSITGLSGDMREFTITNLKTPPSPIEAIDISFINEPAPRHRGDISLYADNYTMRPWTIQNSGGLGNEYSQIRFNCAGSTNPHGPAAVNWVKVTMGIDISLNPPYSTPGYSGTVHFKIRYCDGDSCEVDYLWEPPVINSQSGGIVEQPKPQNVRMFKVGVVPPDSTASISVMMQDSLATIVAVSAPHPVPSTNDSTFSGMNVYMSGPRVIYVPAIPHHKPGRYGEITIAFTPGPGPTKDNYPILVRYYDANGREIGQTEKEIAASALSVDNPSRIIPRGGEITSIVPNPSSASILTNYTLTTSGNARMELFNTLGELVGIIADGWQEQGVHTTTYDVSGLPEGNYMLRLTTEFGSTSLALKIVR